MARRVTRRACSECPCPIENNGTSTAHNICESCGKACQGAKQSARYTQNFEPQRIDHLELPPVFGETLDPAKLAAAARNKRPPLQEPRGRPWNDTRNDPRFNKARQEVPDELRGLSPFRVAVYDLETTDMDGQRGRILSGVVLGFSPEELFVFRADQYASWQAGKRSDDREITADIAACLEAFDIHIAHNGCNFDQRFLAARVLRHRMKPSQPQKIFDPCKMGNRKFGRFSLASAKLDSMADHTGVQNDKTPYLEEMWNRAYGDGDQEALDYIVEHCINDVVTLARLAREIAPWVKQLDMIGSFR